MSYMLPHLHNGWQVDQAILSEEDRVVVIRFGHDWDPTCMKMDEVLYSIAEKALISNVRHSLQIKGRRRINTRTDSYLVRNGRQWGILLTLSRALFGYPSCSEVKNFAVIYLVDITEVPDFNKMYELYDPCTVMFFFRNKHIMIDLGTGNNNKINWAMEDKQEMIDIIETVYRGARKGRGLVVSPKDYSTKYRY
nr:PREDICTED: thioredoxin-like protein 4A [Rhinolophus sinicus]XP_019571438.1 PREDICTED: thioredoxin-like protein 4A [Rhinolophus sinicus]